MERLYFFASKSTTSFDGWAGFASLDSPNLPDIEQHPLPQFAHFGFTGIESFGSPAIFINQLTSTIHITGICNYGHTPHIFVMPSFSPYRQVFLLRIANQKVGIFFITGFERNQYIRWKKHKPKRIIVAGIFNMPPDSIKLLTLLLSYIILYINV